MCTTLLQNREGPEGRRPDSQRPFYTRCKPASWSLDTPAACTRTTDYQSLPEHLPLPGQDSRALPRIPATQRPFVTPWMPTAHLQSCGHYGYRSNCPEWVLFPARASSCRPAPGSDLKGFSCGYEGAHSFEMSVPRDSNILLYCSDSDPLHKPLLPSLSLSGEKHPGNFESHSPEPPSDTTLGCFSAIQTRALSTRVSEKVGRGYSHRTGSPRSGGRKGFVAV